MAIAKRRGKWVLDYYGPNGRRHWKSFATKREAEAFWARIQPKLARGTLVDPRELPTVAQLAKYWLESKQDICHGTRLFYEAALKHVLGSLGHFKLDQLRVETVDWFRSELLAQGLGPRTVNGCLGTLAQVLDVAMRWELIDRNVARIVGRVKYRTRRLVSSEEQEEALEATEVLTPEEARRLIEAAEEGFYRTFFQVALSTGARVGELTALHWEDIDFEANTLVIRRSVAWKAGNPLFSAPKTRAGVRRLTMTEELARVLKEWKLACPPGPLVFATEDGLKPRHRGTIAKLGLKPALKRAGINKRVTLHTLRHTVASMLIMQGVDAIEVARFLGHANPQVTMQIYAHWYNSRKTEPVMGVLERALGLSERPFGQERLTQRGTARTVPTENH
jgi:integrase